MNATGDDHRGLSASHSSDDGATTSRMISQLYTHDDQASILVKALKDFILPLVYAQAPKLTAGNNNDIKYPAMGSEARQLVNALEIFIASLVNVNPQSIRQAENESGKAENLPEEVRPESVQPVTVADPFKSTTPVSEIQVSEKSQVLRLALDAARSRVFNKMPIRLLAFNSDGSDIQLLDRNAIWDHVSALMEANFNENKLRQYVREVNIPNSELAGTALYERYAILSHTWLHDKPGEVTYADWKSGKFDTNSPGYQKLANFCKVAATGHGITLAWMDTICINKESSSELDESIRSMYKWYRNARICITYLAQTTTLQGMRDDPWFTRGWTLQELIAPLSSKFYGAHWQKLVLNADDDKREDSVREEIKAATTITARELGWLEVENTYEVLFTDEGGIPISRRMQWAANRQVTREEDIAYSLMGIFRVSMTIAYGEGSKRAFLRLLQQILNSSTKGVQDVMNWGSGPDLAYHSSDHLSTLLPGNPELYLWRTDDAIHWPLPIIPVTLTHLGLHLSVLIMPAISANLSSQDVGFTPIGDYYGTVNIGKSRCFRRTDTSWMGFPSKSYNVLELDNFVPFSDTDTVDTRGRAQIILGVLNFTATESSVILPSGLCFAVWLYHEGSNLNEAVALRDIELVRYPNGIAFDLQCRDPKSNRRVPKSELAKHGMELHTMYL